MWLTFLIVILPRVATSYSDLSNVIVVEDAPACFRRFAPGRRLADRYLRRTVPTPSLRHCEELCALEETFLCEGFNFRFDERGQGRSSCQLTSVPSDHLDMTMDFNADRNFDFFERDRNAPKSCLSPWGGLRPWTPYSSQRLHGVMGGYGGYGVGGYSMRHPPSDECFVRMRPGFRLDKSIVVLSLTASTLYHCETECANEKNFVCNIFSYRYSQGPSLPGDNCQLGERLFRALDLYTDIQPDRDFDIYSRNEFGRPGCTPQRTFSSDCFERVRSGLGLHSGMTRLAVIVASLQECEQACLTARFFTCRAFSFRYSTPVIGQGSENCRLTDRPVPEMNPGKHLVDEKGCELYHRASYGHGCELDRWPQGRPGEGFRPSGPSGPSGKPSYGTALGNSLYFGDLTGGGKVSTSSQWFGSGPGGLRGSGYLPASAYGDTSGLSSRPLDDFCYVSYNFPSRLLPKSIHNALHVTSEAHCRAECTRARMHSIFRCASLSYRGTSCELSAIELRDLRPGYDFVHDREFRLFSWDFSDARCYVPPAGAPPALPTTLPPITPIPPTGETWQRFTVSGRPCRPGTVCTKNWEVGIWTCPVDDVGEWDYCCRSGHHCGYSEGYNYPWCYVGSADKDQWRPCSDHYYPYVGNDRPMHWPVAYLHREGPPNATYHPPTPRPSLVDAFLQTLNNHLGHVHPPINTSSPDFQVVELKTEPPPENVNGSAMDKLWTWGQSKYNLTVTTVDVSDNTNATSS